MLTLTRRRCRVTAFALLALFLSAMGLLSACAVWCGPMHGTAVALAVAPAAEAAPHSCCAKTTAKKAAEASRKESKKTECCPHEKAVKWVGAPDGPLVKLLKDGSPALDLPPGAFDWQPARWVGAWNRALAVRLVPAHHLPPKIPDIRVFLHSLIV